MMKKRSRILKKILGCRGGQRAARLQQCLEGINLEIIESHNKENKNKEAKAIENIKRNPKYFYAYARSKSKIKTQIGPFENEGSLVTNPLEKAEILKKQFDSVFEKSNHNDYYETAPSTQSENCLENIIISENDIAAKIKELRPTAAPGQDEIPALLLKNCVSSLKAPLCKIFQTTLDSGIIPPALKTGIITPIYKGGDRSKPQNYRPVSLTSHVIKIFEKIVRDKLLNHNSLEKFNENQHGFLVDDLAFPNCWRIILTL